MRKLTVFLLGLLLVSLMTGCASYTPIQRAQTTNITRGADSSDISRILGKGTLLATHTFRAQEHDYRADHYALQTGTRQQMVHCPSRRRHCVPTIQYIPIVDSYVIIYQAATQKVYAWGTVEQLSRSPDDSISNIMPALKASYAALLKTKQ